MIRGKVDSDVGPRTTGNDRGTNFPLGRWWRDGTDSASVDKLADIPGHTGPPVASLEERESTLAAWVSRARGSMKGAQQGRSQGGGDIGFPFWASRWSRLAKSGDTDLFFRGPLDGAIDDGWWNNSFWSGGLFRSMNTGDGVRLDILVSRSIGDGKLKRSKEIPAGQAGV